MKKTFFKTSLIIFIGILLFGCSKDSTPPKPVPTVDFSYSGANLPAPTLVIFTSTTSNATNYLWDFGDNSTSTLSNPQHAYVSGGVYTVKLTVTGEGGTTSSIKTVNVASSLTKVKITKITVTAMPFLRPDGISNWESGQIFESGGPDVFIQIQKAGGVLALGPSGTLSNVTPSVLPLNWDLSTAPYDITDLSVSRFVYLYDSDGVLSPETIGYVGLLFSNYSSGTNPYPSTITQTQNGITITLNLSWY
jgi:PKD repeat protein